jgi:hypothetical protein
LQECAKSTLIIKFDFVEVVQVKLNNVSNHTHNQRVEVLPHSPHFVIALLYALKMCNFAQNFQVQIIKEHHKTKPQIMVVVGENSH